MLKLSNTNGVEITSWIVDKQEIIYQKNGSWSKQDPFLFPTIGNCAQNWTVKNKQVYKPKKHGIFVGTNKEFEKLDDYNYKYLSNDENEYNYKVKIKKSYTENENNLKISTILENKDNETLPYQLGYHLALAIDEQTQIIFQQDKYESHLVDLNKGFVSSKTFEFITNKNWDVDFSIFEKLDSLIFANKQINKLILKTKKYELIFDFENNFDVVTLWTNSKEGDLNKFLCIEPWSCIPTTQNNLNQCKLLKNSSINYSYNITYKKKV